MLVYGLIREKIRKIRKKDWSNSQKDGAHQNNFHEEFRDLVWYSKTYSAHKDSFLPGFSEQDTIQDKLDPDENQEGKSWRMFHSNNPPKNRFSDNFNNKKNSRKRNQRQQGREKITSDRNQLQQAQEPSRVDSGKNVKKSLKKGIPFSRNEKLRNNSEPFNFERNEHKKGFGSGLKKKRGRLTYF